MDLVAPNSIYPCLDEFSILVNKPELDTTQYVRLLRVYVAEQRTTKWRQLQYVREHKLPLNNLLNLDCHSFSPAFKFYCFVYVALNASSGAVAVRGPVICKPTVIDVDTDTVNDVPDDEPDIQLLASAGPSLDVRATGQYGLTNAQRQNRHEASDTVGYAAPIDVSCDCSNKHVEVRLSNSSAANIVRVHISRCTGNYDYSLSPVIDHGSEHVNVCVLKLTERSAPTIVELASPLTLMDTSGTSDSSLRLRDGQLAVDPLIHILANGSIRHRLKSRYLRLECQRDLQLALRLSPEHRGEVSASRTSVTTEPPANSSLSLFTLDLLRPIHYTVLAFSGFVVIATLLYALVYLTVRVSRPKVQILELEAEPPTTSESQLAASQHSFSFADADSMEMDYYDYNVTLLPHSKSFSVFRETPDSDDRNDDKISL